MLFFSFPSINNYLLFSETKMSPPTKKRASQWAVVMLAAKPSSQSPTTNQNPKPPLTKPQLKNCSWNVTRMQQNVWQRPRLRGNQCKSQWSSDDWRSFSTSRCREKTHKSIVLPQPRFYTCERIQKTVKLPDKSKSSSAVSIYDFLG